MNFAELLAQRAQEIPEEGAFGFLHDGVDDVKTVSFAALHADACALAAELLAHVPPGARALLLLPPGPDYGRAVYACFQAGVIGVSAPPPHPKQLERTLSRLLRIVDDAGVEAVLTLEAMKAGAEGLRGEHPRLGDATWIALDDPDLRERRVTLPPPAAAPGDVAFLQYTSGSTMAPRGVMLTHANLIDNSTFISRSFGITAETRGFNWLPPYHDMGLIGGILQPVFVGGTSILMSPLAVIKRPLWWLEGISRHRATVSGGPNFAYDLCLRRIGEEEREGLDLSSWEVAFDGAEPIRAETINAFSEAFAPAGFRRSAFYPCYGLAEATLMVTGPELGSPPATLSVDAAALNAGRIESVTKGGREVVLVGCGRPDDSHEVAIVDPDTRRRCGPGEIGEIWVSGPSVSPGYWGDAEAGRVFGALLADDESGREYLRSGDLGTVQDGELYVIGRIKELIILNGRNFHPHDIEVSAEAANRLVRQHCSAAFSIDVDGSEGVALVIEVDDAGADADAVIGDVRRRVASDVEVQLQQVVVCSRGAVPKTTSGKIQRLLCREMVDRGEMEPLASWKRALC
ncbi:MAG: fatty acyl-AMP ligase [Solirubrobacterales bacterium]